MATYSSNTTLRYSAAASSGGTVPANSFAVCTYTCTALDNTTSSSVTLSSTTVVTRVYAAGATILATFTAVYGKDNQTVNRNATYTFASGFILSNSP